MPTGVVEKKLYDTSKAESVRTGKPRKVLKTYRYVRVRYIGLDGKQHVKQEPYAGNATDAGDVRKGIKKELSDHGEASLHHRADTFGDLADYYKAKYLVPAKYVDGKKIAGRRNLSNPESQLKRLRLLVGERRRLREITYEVLRDVRLAFLSTPTQKTAREPEGHQRSMVDVNRHLQLLRHMLKVARRNKWIHDDPFANAEEPLITPADERKRRRVMSLDEERAVLSYCVGRREHLRLVIIGLVDSLMRSGEFFKLRVRDLSLDLRQVAVQQLNTKTLSYRAAPLALRFAGELERWCEAKNLGPDDRVFDFESVKRSFAGACEDAGVVDLVLKDLRRTGATRLLRGGMPIEEISRILGHTSVAMTYEYIGVDRDTTGRAVDIIDAIHRGAENPEVVH